MGAAPGFTTAPYMVAGDQGGDIPARGREHSRAEEQKNDRDSDLQGTDHHEDLPEQAEAAAVAHPSQP